jgi:hypothetical protein
MCCKDSYNDLVNLRKHVLHQMGVYQLTGRLSVSVLTLMMATMYSFESLVLNHQAKCCHIEAYENMAYFYIHLNSLWHHLTGNWKVCIKCRLVIGEVSSFKFRFSVAAAAMRCVSLRAATTTKLRWYFRIELQGYISHMRHWFLSWWYSKGADKSLARPGRKQATATEDFDVHISYL